MDLEGGGGGGGLWASDPTRLQLVSMHLDVLFYSLTALEQCFSLSIFPVITCHVELHVYTSKSIGKAKGKCFPLFSRPFILVINPGSKRL